MKTIKKLWVNGFSEFELIYGIRFSELKNNLEKSLLKKYPTKPNIDWESFKEGCIQKLSTTFAKSHG